MSLPLEISREDSKGRVKKLTRGRSSKACAPCHKRKVRCDVSSKNHPTEKCTNCYEFNIDCIIKERKKKVKKLLSESSVTSSDEQKRFNEDETIYQKKPPLTERLSHILNVDGASTYIRGLNASSTYLRPNYADQDPSNFLYLDPKVVLADKLKNSILSQLYTSSSAFISVQSAVDDYVPSIKRKRPLHHITKETIDTLKQAGVFTLPDESSCIKYIEAYFVVFHPLYPMINKRLFLSQYSDLTNPPSLLLLRSVLFIGSRVLSFAFKNQLDPLEVDEHNRSLYHKARLLYDANVERQPIPLVTSIFLLSCDPGYDVSLRTAYSHLAEAAQMATFFSMHKNQDDNPKLTIEEQKNYKVLFWMIFYRDRTLALSFNKKFLIDIEECTVKFLTWEDVESRFLTGQAVLWHYYLAVLKMAELITELFSQRKLADKLVAKGSSCNALVEHMDTLVKSCMSSFPNDLKLRKENMSNVRCIALNLYHLQVSLNIHCSNIVRRATTLKKMMQKENYITTLPANKSSSRPIAYEWLKCFESAHSICKLSRFLVRGSNVLIFVQNVVGVVYFGAVSMLPFLYHADPEIRKTAKLDLQEYQEVLDMAGITWMQTGKWPMVDTSKYIIDEIYPNEKKLISYLRKVLNSDDLEYVLFSSPDAVDHNIRRLVLEEAPPFIYPIYHRPTESQVVVANSSYVGTPHLDNKERSVGPSKQFEENNIYQYTRFLPNLDGLSSITPTNGGQFPTGAQMMNNSSPIFPPTTDPNLLHVPSRGPAPLNEWFGVTVDQRAAQRSATSNPSTETNGSLPNATFSGMIIPSYRSLTQDPSQTQQHSPVSINNPNPNINPQLQFSVPTGEAMGSGGSWYGSNLQPYQPRPPPPPHPHAQNQHHYNEFSDGGYGEQ
ncbi:hypothetical protein CANARDRAFT_21783 [[Candida] arabinofermentans NRRL YB-2248]|uniref:Zn(2)-C6 fungal-type domain-containing protein n=1 Tax=[Candida] arabinofermentans NRRL YB-2248 TaxID=983967 RepID=A0A1E4T4Z0_9ASCO|nr:hypothetical protein CANARDRAFT_21783 [[Candida] arabinofermentans NRRL YB-2248]